MTVPTPLVREPVYVSISGIIGAGKSTLAQKLGPILGLPVYEEGVIDNVFLSKFYNDMAKYSFPLQIHLLNRRFVQQQKIVWDGLGGVQDRTIYEDQIFAKMLYESNLMEKEAYETYCALFRNMSRFMSRPSLIVHLDVTPEQSLRRINERNRECESGIKLEYLQKLHLGYENFLQEISTSVRVIRVDWSEFIDTDKVAQAILREHAEMLAIRSVHVK